MLILVPNQVIPPFDHALSVLFLAGCYLLVCWNHRCLFERYYLPCIALPCLRFVLLLFIVTHQEQFCIQVWGNMHSTSSPCSGILGTHASHYSRCGAGTLV